MKKHILEEIKDFRHDLANDLTYLFMFQEKMKKTLEKLDKLIKNEGE